MTTKDLSQVHELASDLFQWPKSTKDWEKYMLSDQQVAFFNENGYLAGIKMLEDAQINFLRNELTEIADVHHPGHKFIMNFILMNLPIHLLFYFMPSEHGV